METLQEQESATISPDRLEYLKQAAQEAYQTTGRMVDLWDKTRADNKQITFEESCILEELGFWPWKSRGK